MMEFRSLPTYGGGPGMGERSRVVDAARTPLPRRSASRPNPPQGGREFLGTLPRFGCAP
jgi:hypothetical protein